MHSIYYPPMSLLILIVGLARAALDLGSVELEESPSSPAVYTVCTLSSEYTCVEERKNKELIGEYISSMPTAC